jgi:hypothetical protein
MSHLNLTNGHGRYITVTPERALLSDGEWPLLYIYYKRYKFVTASLPKRLRNGRFASETATWIQKWFKISAGASRKLHMYSIIVFQGGDDGRGYTGRNIYKILQGRT